ncbi:MAG: ral secretion pathway protein [Acetobacteraceae bacterium]|nr:ral secretion pathway protein [Acetobacteraceae bacterium]
MPSPVLPPIPVALFSWFAGVLTHLGQPAGPRSDRRIDTAMTPDQPTMPTRQGGFSLLEVLIALIISGIALVTVFQAAGETMRATGSAARHQQALSRAISHLDGAGANLVPGELEGDDGGGFHWRVAVRAIDSNGKQDTTGKPVPNTDTLVVTLYAVTVSITWRDGQNQRLVRLDSRRLSTSAPG